MAVYLQHSVQLHWDDEPSGAVACVGAGGANAARCPCERAPECRRFRAGAAVAAVAAGSVAVAVAVG